MTDINQLIRDEVNRQLTTGLNFGTIKSSKLEKNAESGPEVYVCKTQVSGPKDVQSLENEHHTGSQSRPPKESRVFFGWFNPAWKFIVGVFDGVPKQVLNEGERVAYASKDGAIVCSLYYKDDGTIQIDTDLDLIANVGGETILNSTGNVTATTPVFNIVGKLNVTGTIDATGIISSEIDVISDSAATAISAKDHKHTDSVGGPTTAPVPGGSPPPAPIPYDTHTHTQGNDSAGDSQVTTGAPQ